MKDKLTILSRNYPFFVFLLPVFFVLHGFTENYNFIPVDDALLLTGLYLVSSIVLTLLSWLFYRNWLKSAVVTSMLMSFHFFFGSLQDGLRHIFHDSFISRYVFILPVALLVFIIVIVVLKKRNRPVYQLAFYLNLLFLLLIIMDTAWLISKTIKQDKNQVDSLSKEFIRCDTCSRPDVYIIIADEYAGNNELRDIFHFDNAAFIDQLAKRDFHIIPNSSSNYNYTPYSIASTLNMEYLGWQPNSKQPLLTYTYETIRDNSFLRFLQSRQYQFYNYSFFDFKGQPANTQETFLPVKTTLITSQTFLSRLNKELRFNLVTKLDSKKELNRLTYLNRQNNEKLYSLTINAINKKSDRPKFVLTHLMLPHYPYYYDKNGKEFPFEQITEGNQSNRNNYIEYLQYGNKRLLELVDAILKNSSSPPVIILMGDHGFRHFNEPIDTKYYFCNLVSVHLPGNNYAAFTDSLTNVNLLKTVLNTSFGQRLAYLKDTAIIMDNP
jgi:Sulfatase